MKHELVQLQKLTGMKLVRRGNSMMLCGYYRGFATVTNLNSRARCYDVVIWASRAGEDMAPQMNQWLAEYVQRNPACTGGSATHQMMVGHIAMGKKRDITAQSILAFYNDATSWLSANGMVSSCESCGSGESAIYNLGGRLHTICPRCLEEMTAQAKAEQTPPGTFPPVWLGPFSSPWRG